MASFSGIGSNKKFHVSPELPEELLDLIFICLPMQDRFRFGAVCTLWRSIMLKMHRHCRPSPLLMLGGVRLPPPPQSNTKSKYNLFYLLDGGRNQFRELIALRLKFNRISLGRPRCHGSAKGWLLIYSLRLKQLYLLNPVSGTKIDLPPPRKQPIFARVLSSSPTSNDCIVVVKGSYSDSQNALESCRITGGDHCRSISGWEPFYLRGTTIRSMSFHKGLLYILGQRDKVTRIYNFDPQQPKAKMIGSVPPISLWRHMFFVATFVESKGELLLVVKTFAPNFFEIRGFCVFKLDQARGAWVQIKSLGDHQVILLSDRNSESFSTEGFMGSTGFRGNCIYCYERGFNSHQNVLYLYSMADQSLQTIVVPESGPAVEWFLPRLW